MAAGWADSPGGGAAGSRPGALRGGEEDDPGETLEELLLLQESEEDRLRSISGQFDLRDVTTIELKVDTREMAVSSMGEKLPKLQELKLNGSFVPQLRDLGTSLQQLRVLWLARSNLEELAGVASGLPLLQELYVSFNEIRDVSSLADMDHLEVVDLESNRISDLESVDYLSMCPALRSLTLSGNPLAFELKDGLRHAVASRLPLLEYLDDEPVTEADREEQDASPKAGAGVGGHGEEGGNNSGVLVDGLECASDTALSSEELALISDGIKYARVGIDDEEFEERAIEADVAAGLGSRPSTAAPALRPGKRPGTGTSYTSASSTSRGSTPGSRPVSALYRPRSGSGSERPSSTGSRGSSGSAEAGGGEGIAAGERASSKVQAKPLAGGAAAALLQRRAGNHGGVEEGASETQAAPDQAPCDEHDSMLAELRRWKLETAELVTADQAEARELAECLCDPARLEDEHWAKEHEAGGSDDGVGGRDASEYGCESRDPSHRPSRPLDSAGARSNVPPPRAGNARPVGGRSGKPPRPMSASIKDLYQFVKGENDIAYFNEISTKLYSDEE